MKEDVENSMPSTYSWGISSIQHHLKRSNVEYSKSSKENYQVFHVIKKKA
jgi:hypothetical protein